MVWGAAGACAGARALIGAGEVALGRVPLSRVRILAAQGRRSGQALLALKTDPEGTWWSQRMLGQILVAAAGGFGGWAAVRTAGPSPVVFWLASALAVLVTLGLDLVLRSLAVAHAEVFARWLAPPLRALALIGKPLRTAAAGLAERLTRPLGSGRPSLAPALTSLEDVEAYLAAESGQGRLGSTDPDLLRSVLEFSEKTAREVMVPRTGIVAVELSTPPEEVVRLVAERGHSRLPVYRETMDDIIGILHTRDLVPLLANPKLLVIQDVMRPVAFVPWAKPIGALLREMQGRRSHLAVVVDEYGGVMGIVTLEDILEEIVGEIRDELRPEGRNVEVLPDGAALVRASISVDEFDKTFGVRLGAGGYETLAGWLNAQSGAIPEQGDRFFADGIQLTVVERTPKRVRRVKVARARARPSGEGSGRAHA
ncbi:MAG: hemolysin family protein [Myxococcales bacterium]